MKYLIEIVVNLNEEPSRLQWIPETFEAVLEEGESIIKWSCVNYIEELT